MKQDDERIGGKRLPLEPIVGLPMYPMAGLPLNMTVVLPQ